MIQDQDEFVWLPVAVKGQLETVRVKRCFVSGLPKQIQRFVSEPYPSRAKLREDTYLKRQTCAPLTFELTMVAMSNGCRVPIYIEDPKDPDAIKMAEAFWVNAGKPRQLY